jgi:uncharacterized membrane protein YqaE (UPF0057 family)
MLLQQTSTVFEIGSVHLTIFNKKSRMKKTFTCFLVAVMSITMFVTPASAINVTKSTTETEKTTEASAKDALTEFKSLSRKEKKERFRNVKKALSQFKKDKKAGNEPSTNTLLLVILAILLPPLAVYLHEGEINTKFWISLILTLLFFVPGIIYALIVVLG